MQRGHKVSHRLALVMPEGFDPSGVPQFTFGRTETPLCASHRASPLPGLPPASRITTVERIEAAGDGTWHAWGTLGDRPVLFSVDSAAAAEMADSIARGELTTAVIEPSQVLLEPLD